MTAAARSFASVIGIVAALALGAPHADARSRARPPSQCVVHRTHAEWAADPSPRAIYICVGARDVYRLDVAGLCTQLRAPKVRLRTRLVSGGWDRRPLIIELEASDGHATQLPCKVTGITALGPAETKAVMGSPRPAH
jgi:hypothetical protein